MSVFPPKRMHTPVSPQKRVHFRCYLVLGTGEHTQHSISVFRFIPLLLRSPARPLDVSFVVVVVVWGGGGVCTVPYLTVVLVTVRRMGTAFSTEGGK